MNSNYKNAIIAGSLAALLLTITIYTGSRGFKYFDPAVLVYLLASIISIFALGYRLALWGQRPPTKRLFIEGFRSLFHQEGRRQAKMTYLFQKLSQAYAMQKFIQKRSWLRWVMHMCLSWGTMLAFVFIFPLIFGWIHFESLPDDIKIYQVFLFGFKVDQFHVDSLKALVAFNILNVSAILVLIGVIIAAFRRFVDPETRVTQRFTEDILPLIILFVVSASGLMLTVNARWMHGEGFVIYVTVHAASVVILLLYIPFGKLFHAFQRSAHLLLAIYKHFPNTRGQAHCLRCGNEYAAKQQVKDLKEILDELGFNYRFNDHQGSVQQKIHYQDICPGCRRGLLALNQGASIGR